MRYLIGVIAGVALTITTERYAPRILWAMFSRGDR
jgi:hypothetical protein